MRCELFRFEITKSYAYECFSSEKRLLKLQIEEIDFTGFYFLLL